MLKVAAVALTSALRETDLVARCSGEEFLAVLPHTTLQEAMSALSRVKIVMAAQIAPGLRTPATLSAGVARYREGESPIELVERANKLLCRAKREGRDRFIFSDDAEQ